MAENRLPYDVELKEHSSATASDGNNQVWSKSNGKLTAKSNSFSATLCYVSSQTPMERSQ